MKRITIILLLLLTTISCTRGGWTKGERELILDGPEVMRVLTVDDREDNVILRSASTDIPASELSSEEYASLARKLVATVTDPSQEGVGIAGPQVGILRRIVAVQRFDKPLEPFEVYSNIRITAMRGPLQKGPEGCLSIPGRRGEVERSYEIDINYTSPTSLRDTVETVKGFTAVIFQHECDHLDGTVYTDHIWDSDESWFCPLQDSCAVDVFYLVSTEVIESHAPDGTESFNAVLDSSARAAMREEMAFVRDRLFPDSLNFIAPFYHQATMHALMASADIFRDSYERARLEVIDAFDRYMSRSSTPRPFILAGFSQGSMLILDLLKHLTDEQYSHLVCAYVIGYAPDSTDLTCSHIVPARGETDTGVTVSFNSVRDLSGIWPAVHHDAATCINPVNWRTDATPATIDWQGETLTVTLDTLHRVLLIPGLTRSTNPGFWPAACLHLEDLTLYADQIRRNAVKRGNSFGRAEINKK